MYGYILLGFLMLFAASCQKAHQASGQNIETTENIVSKSPEEKPRNELLEFFSESSTIGLPNKNKIEISNFRNSSGDVLNRNAVIIKFYSLSESNEWNLKQTFEFEKDDVSGCDPEFEDFNNDGLKDFTYVSAVAARGANEVRKLFIYDEKRDELTYIKNSEYYPNLQYNEKLDCLDAWLFHGGTTTVFLKIDKDVLKEFARVDSGGLERTVALIDKNGKERLLRKDKITEGDIYERYKNFNPLEAYREEK